MSLQAIIESHITKMAEIQQQGADFAKRVAEHHVEVVERKLKPELQIAAKVIEHVKPKTEDVA